MHHHFSTYYEIDKKFREEELQRQLQQKFWVRQMQAQKPRRIRRWRTLIANLVGYFF